MSSKFENKSLNFFVKNEIFHNMSLHRSSEVLSSKEMFEVWKDVKKTFVDWEVKKENVAR